MRYGIGVGMTAVLMAAAPAHAAGDANAAKGIVVEHCIACHEVAGYAAKNRVEAVEAPAFQTLADDPSTYTDARLRSFMMKPHYPMKGLILSPSDIDNLIAFIRIRRRP